MWGLAEEKQKPERKQPTQGLNEFETLVKVNTFYDLKRNKSLGPLES